MVKTDDQILAEFMGNKPIYSDSKLVGYHNRNGITDIEDLEYRKSWDWLMPVVKKLLTDMSNTVYSLRSTTEWSNAIRGDIERSIWDYTYSRGTIEIVYNEIVAGIQWYNTSSQK